MRGELTCATFAVTRSLGAQSRGLSECRLLTTTHLLEALVIECFDLSKVDDAAVAAPTLTPASAAAIANASTPARSFVRVNMRSSVSDEGPPAAADGPSLCYSVIDRAGIAI